MPGLLILFGTALAVSIILLTAMLVREARRPPRRTAAYAVARGWACDPDDVGLQYETWTLDRPDGAHLPVWDIDLGGTGFTAVFVHGWGQSKIDMLRRLEPWKTRCGRAIMYDLRGHGEAEDSLSQLGHHEDNDLLDLIHRLDEPVVLVAHSMGAVIGLHAAARDTEGHIQGVIAHGPYTDFHRSLQGRLRSAGYPVWPISMLAMTWFRLRGIRHERLNMGNITCPVLVLHGVDDDVSPLAHGRAIAEGVHDGALAVIDNAGHTDLMALAPEQIASSIDEFLRQKLPWTSAGVSTADRSTNDAESD